jgi:hypothetical protein
MRRIPSLFCLILVTASCHAQLQDPCCETSPPWTLCRGIFDTIAPCSPPAPSCGTYAYYFSDGAGIMDESGLYQCFLLTYGGPYDLSAYHDMGLPTPTGGGAVFQLRMAPSPVSCGDLCAAGELLYSSNTHNCGAWSFTGLLTYTPSSAGTYCLIAVACGNEGWSCGGLTAVDDLYFQIHGDPAVEDWVLY